MITNHNKNGQDLLLAACFLYCRLQVYYLIKSNERYAHERANGSYSVAAYYFAELTVTSLALLVSRSTPDTCTRALL